MGWKEEWEKAKNKAREYLGSGGGGTTGEESFDAEKERRHAENIRESERKWAEHLREKEERHAERIRQEQRSKMTDQEKMFEKGQEAIQKGLKQGEAEAGKYTPDIDYKAEATDILRRKKDKAEKGLTAAEYTPVKQRFRTSSRALRGAMARSGIRGGTAAQATASAYRTAQEQMAALDAGVRDQALRDVEQTIARHQFQKVSLPLAYARLASGQFTSNQQLALAGQEPPKEDESLFSKLFKGIF